ncbi:MAG: hypothetical protein ACI8XX_000644 [Polaribacter sp.]|jgi:hypothetical protein
MKIGQSTSSETFADFTLSRVRKNVLESLTDEQYDAIRSALITENKQERHSIDIRLWLPLFLNGYYLVLLVGRDRRSSSFRLEGSRFSSIPKPLRSTIRILFSFLVLLVVFSVAFMMLYKIKNLMGINILSDFHLSDLLSWAGFPENSKLAY